LHSVDRDRLWQAHMDMATIGATAEGGSNRPALSLFEGEARSLLLHWCEPLGLKLHRDGIGNLFLHRPGTEARPAVAFGSHLDTVPTGGRFDGVFGVLAGLEVMRALDGTALAAPLELVVWTNEEGTRFAPAMMGSRVHAGDMTLEHALAVTDDEGVSVAEALVESGQVGLSPPAPRDWACWIEPHIEQGPMLEAEGADIGIVTGTMQARYFKVRVIGAPSHVGATPMDKRRDSLAAGAEMILAAERVGQAAEPSGRSSAAWIQNEPNARGAVPSLTRLHLDVRHATEAGAAGMERDLLAAVYDIAARRGVQVEIDPYARFGPVQFDAGLGQVLREVAAARQLSVRDAQAAAGHDSVLVAALCPSAMIFVPSRDGLTHHPGEYSSAAQLAAGAQVLLDAVLRLAR
jgi:N-carbamoyl-L-amino-acid hydrolase